MPALEQITPQNVLTFKAVRLEALQDSPSAFGSTYAKESQLSDEDWLEFAADLNSDKSVGYIAMDRGAPCGIVAAFLREEDPLKAHMISMWVAPAHRRAGLGRALIRAIRTWAASRGAHVLQLAVTSNNLAAIRFYEKEGFSMTGNAEPYANDPNLMAWEMSQPIETG